MKNLIFLGLTLLPLSLFAEPLQELHPVTPPQEYYIAPEWGSGGQLYCSAPKYASIARIDLETGTVQTLVEGRGVGYEFAFAPDGSIFHKLVGDGWRELRRLGQDGSEHLLLRAEALGLPAWFKGAMRVFTPNGTRCWEASGAAIDAPAEGWVYQDGNAIYMQTDEGVKRISQLETDAFLPRVSPDGVHLVYETLPSGLILVNHETGASVSLGNGNNACWSSDGTFLLFDRTQDDGHNLTAGDIIMVNADGSNPANLTVNSDLIATHPAISPDGRQIAFEAKGRIWVGKLIPNP